MALLASIIRSLAQAAARSSPRPALEAAADLRPLVAGAGSSGACGAEPAASLAWVALGVALAGGGLDFFASLARATTGVTLGLWPATFLLRDSAAFLADVTTRGLTRPSVALKRA